MSGQSRDRIQLAWIGIAVLVFANYYVWSITPRQYFGSPVYWIGYIAWALAGSYAILGERIVPPYDRRRRLTIGSPPFMYDPVLTGLLLAILAMFALSHIAPETFIAVWAMEGILGGLMVYGSILLLRRLARG